MKKFKWNKGAALLMVISLAYIAGGGAAITVYARDGRSAETKTAESNETLRAEAPVENDYDMSTEEYEEFMKLYGSAATETETESEAPKETEQKEDLSAYQEVLSKTDEVLKNAEKSSEEESEEESEETLNGSMEGETVKTETTNESDEAVEVTVLSEAGQETAAASEAKSSEEKSSEEKSEEENRTYYTYQVSGIGTSLTLHRTKKEKNDSIGDIPEGYKGYVLADPEAADKRTLIIYKGIVGYGSNMYLKKTEISAEEFPEELKSLTGEDAGKTLFNGKEAGPLEGG